MLVKDSKYNLFAFEKILDMDFTKMIVYKSQWLFEESSTDVGKEAAELAYIIINFIINNIPALHLQLC